MKRITNLLIIAILALSFASCSYQDENSETKKLESAKLDYFSKTISNNEKDEFISLLSIKYDLNSKLTHKIINEFPGDDAVTGFSTISEAKNVAELERLKTKFARPTVEERIRKISSENNIDQSIVASFLIDYKIWYKAQDAGTYE